MSSGDVAQIVVTLFNNNCLGKSLLTISHLLETELGFNDREIDNAIDMLLIKEVQ